MIFFKNLKRKTGTNLSTAATNRSMRPAAKQPPGTPTADRKQSAEIFAHSRILTFPTQFSAAQRPNRKNDAKITKTDKPLQPRPLAVFATSERKHPKSKTYAFGRQKHRFWRAKA